jgi:hypothetical protein
MHSHIQNTHRTYYMRPFPPAPAQPAASATLAPVPVAAPDPIDVAQQLKDQTAAEKRDVKLTELDTLLTAPPVEADTQDLLETELRARLQKELDTEKAGRAADKAKHDADVQALQENIDKQALAIQQLEDDIAAQTTALEKHKNDLEKSTEDKEAVEQALRDKEEERKKIEDALAQTTQEHDNTKKDLEAKDRDIERHTQKLKDMQEKIEENTGAVQTLNTEIEVLQRQLTEKDDEIARLKAEIDRLTALLADTAPQLQALTEKHTQEIEALKNTHKTETDDLEEKLRAAEAELTSARTLGSQDTQNKDTEIAALKATIASLRDQLDQQTQQLQQVDTRLAAAVQTKRAGLKAIQKTIAANVQGDIALLHLTDKLEAAETNNNEYLAIRDAVIAADTAKNKKTYSDAATFLILESMGGTWRMYLKLVRGKKPDSMNATMFIAGKNGQIREYEENRDLVLRQMLYDLTMWYSMQNRPHKTRYMSHHVQAFITAFGLDNSELTNSNVDSSDDDGPGPPADPADKAPDLIPATAQALQKPDDMRPSTPTKNRGAAGLYRAPSGRKIISGTTPPGNPQEILEQFKAADEAAENQRLEAERPRQSRDSRSVDTSWHG